MTQPRDGRFLANDVNTLLLHLPFHIKPAHRYNGRRIIVALGILCRCLILSASYLQS